MSRDSPAHELTVALFCYNQANFVADAIAALYSALPATSELLIFDDHSSDGSVSIITKSLREEPQPRLFFNESNRGLIPNLNTALEVAKGRYIFFAAADDLIYPQMLTRCLNLLRKYPEAGLCSTMSDQIDEQGRLLGRIESGMPSLTDDYLSPSQSLRFLMRNDSWFMGNVAVYRADALRRIDGFRPELMSFSDGFNCRLLALKFGACFIPEALGAWRLMASGYAASTARDRERSLTIGNTAIALMNEEFADYFPASYSRRWLKRYLFHSATSADQQALVLRNRLSKLGRLAVYMKLFWALFWYRPFDVYPAVHKRLLGIFRRSS
ncbi:MAG: glycosyltransferase [Pseudomonadota bacterium]